MTAPDTDWILPEDLMPGDVYYESPNWLRPDGHVATVSTVTAHPGGPLEDGTFDDYIRVTFTDGGILAVSLREKVQVVS